MTLPIHAVLFDLDGTLLDTAPDLLQALNRLRQKFNLSPLPLHVMHALTSSGSKAMVKHALNIDENNKDFAELRNEFLADYEKNIAHGTVFYPEMENVLLYLDQKKIPWGIVTNKLTKHTKALLQTLQFEQRPACVICGDTLPQSKPHPAPILYACELLQKKPENCLYVGDAATDVAASKAAGTRSLVALYGYTGSDDPFSWQADGYIRHPTEILDWLRTVSG